MPPLTLEPIIVEPKNHRDRQIDRSRGQFELHDYDWPVETDPRYKVTSGGPLLHWPHFPPGLVAEAVFGQNPEWMKTRLKGAPYNKAPLMIDQDTPLVIPIVPRGRTGERRFSLAMIERLAWALYQRGDIDGHQLQCACTIAKAMAEQYRRRLED